MKLGTNERVRLELVVRRAAWTAGADGGRAFVRHALEDTGFTNVTVYLPSEARPATWNPAPHALVTELPEWLASAEATWGQQGAELADDLGELRVAQVWPAPAPPPKPPSSAAASGWMRAAIFGGVAAACGLLTWLLTRGDDA